MFLWLRLPSSGSDRVTSREDDESTLSTFPPEQKPKASQKCRLAS